MVMKRSLLSQRDDTFLFDVSGVTTAQRKLTLRGRVVFSGDSRIIEAGSKVNVVLQDTSLADAPAREISRFSASATRFPVAFSLKYSPASVNSVFSYSLSVRIVNSNGELLFINDVHIPVKLTGADRTKFVDASVIRVKRKLTRYSRRPHRIFFLLLTASRTRSDCGDQNAMARISGSDG